MRLEENELLPDAKRPVGVISLIGGYGGLRIPSCTSNLAIDGAFASEESAGEPKPVLAASNLGGGSLLPLGLALQSRCVILAPMRAAQSDTRSQAPHDLPKSLPDIELRHGEALWVMARLGFQGAASKAPL